MFPNPQDSLPLPQHPGVEQYKKLAKELLRASKSNDPEAIRKWSADWVKGLVERSGIVIAPQLPVRTDAWIRNVANFAQAKLPDGGKLSDAQFVIARSHGFVWACGYAYADVVEFLLLHGADLDDDAGSDEPPLHMAVVGASLSIVKLRIARRGPPPHPDG